MMTLNDIAHIIIKSLRILKFKNCNCNIYNKHKVNVLKNRLNRILGELKPITSTVKCVSIKKNREYLIVNINVLWIVNERYIFKINLYNYEYEIIKCQ